MSFTLWFTGLSGAGKTTLSRMVYFEIRRRGFKAELLDGDIIRTNFSQELTFNRRDRDINVRRIGFVCHLLNKNDVIGVVAAIAPYDETRQYNRRLIENYNEVYVNCPLEVCEKRDVKGLYARARRGEIRNFTGISDPYEPPVNPEIEVRTNIQSPDESMGLVIAHLEEKELLSPRERCRMCDYSEEDERAWREKLASLGFCRS